MTEHTRTRRPAQIAVDAEAAAMDAERAVMTDAETDAERADFNRRNPSAPSAMAEHYWR